MSKKPLQKKSHKVHRVSLNQDQIDFLSSGSKSLSRQAASAIYNNIQYVTTLPKAETSFKTISLSGDILEQIKQISRDKNKSVAEIIRACIDIEMQKIKTKNS